MELTEALRRRRMVRSFTSQGLDEAVVGRLLEATAGAPSAGNTMGTAWMVLSTLEERSSYWDRTTTAQWRARSRRWAGLSAAPVVLLSLTSPEAYLERYSEPSKASSGLGRPPEGGGAAAWAVPYWFSDAAFETMALLLAVTEEGLGACLLGNFRGEDALLRSLGVPAGWRLFASVVVGHPAADDAPSGSLGRGRDVPRLHWGRWGN